jgi:hypothetical protein
VKPSRHRPAAILVAPAVLTAVVSALLALSTPAFASDPPAGALGARSPTLPVGPHSPVPALDNDDDTTDTNSGLRLQVDSMSPRLVTASGPNTLIVTGTLTNTGSAPIGDLGIRAQLSDRLRSEGDIRTALAGNVQDSAVTPTVTKLDDRFMPGAHLPFQLSVPLRGSPTSSLALQHQGVYQVLLNVTGREGVTGAKTRMAGARVLLPVVGLPAAPAMPAQAPAPPAGPPRPVSVLYPIADQPRRLPTGPGEAVVLSDDVLADELSKNGRLDGLLSGLETNAPPGSPVHDAVCVAIDPDLLRTVSEMTTGYQVRSPDGTMRPGRGQAAATDWLNRLKNAAAGRCVFALPFADADLVALSRAGLDDLARYATSEGARITSELLATPVRTTTTWPEDSVLDERSLGDYAKAGGAAVVLSADSVSGKAARTADGGTVKLATPGATSVGLLADPLVASAASGGEHSRYNAGTIGNQLTRGPLVDSSAQLNPTNGGGALSAQDAIGAIAFRATSGGSDPVLVAPPHRWNTTAADAGGLLAQVNALISAGRLTAAKLADQPAPGSDPATLVYPIRAGAREVPSAVTASLRSDRDLANQLRSAAIPAQGVGTTPAQVFDPVTEGFLRAASSVWRGQPHESRTSAKIMTDRVAFLRSLVRVVEPPTPYALGSKDAPLPITLANGLPVAMRVKVVLSYTPGLKISAITPDPLARPIPPLGRLQLRADTSLTRSGQFSVEARLTTVAGVPLGFPSRLVLRSTAYGTITLWLTGTAFLLLVILAVRRITRRVRGSSAERRTAPELTPPTEPGTTLAATSREPNTPTAPGTEPEIPPPTPARPRRTAAHERDPAPRRLGAAARAEDAAALDQLHHSAPGPPQGPGRTPARKIGRGFSSPPSRQPDVPAAPIPDPPPNLSHPQQVPPAPTYPDGRTYRPTRQPGPPGTPPRPGGPIRPIAQPPNLPRRPGRPGNPVPPGNPAQGPPTTKGRPVPPPDRITNPPPIPPIRRPQTPPARPGQAPPPGKKNSSGEDPRPQPKRDHQDRESHRPNDQEPDQRTPRSTRRPASPPVESNGRGPETTHPVYPRRQ